jgi:hypothetical protein
MNKLAINNPGASSANIMESTSNTINDNPSAICGKKMTLGLKMPSIPATGANVKGDEDANSVKKFNPSLVSRVDEDSIASLPIQSIAGPVRETSNDTTPRDCPLQNTGRSNSMSTEDLARDSNTSAETTETSHSFVTGSIEAPIRVKRSKKQKATQRMRPKSHSPRRTAATDGKPLVDLRQILKKHEKKSQTKVMYDDNDSFSDFYGSLSSIPFLHPDNEEKKPRKGKRCKKKKSSLTHDSSNKEKAPKVTSKITVTKEYTDADVQLWKSMSALDGSYMEEVSQRPDIMLPLTKPAPSNKKKKALESPAEHSECAVLQPDEMVENDHSTSRISKEKTNSKKDCDESESPTNFERSETAKIEGEKAVETALGEESETKKAQQIQNQNDGIKENSNAETLHQLEPPVTTPSKKKKHKKTKLAFAFQDGCVISGDFRPKERIERVKMDLQQEILRSDVSLPDIDLYVIKPDSEGKERLNPKATLVEAGLVPSGEIFIQWKDPMEIGMSPGWYLNSCD